MRFHSKSPRGAPPRRARGEPCCASPLPPALLAFVLLLAFMLFVTLVVFFLALGSNLDEARRRGARVRNQGAGGRVFRCFWQGLAGISLAGDEVGWCWKATAFASVVDVE